MDKLDLNTVTGYKDINKVNENENLEEKLKFNPYPNVGDDKIFTNELRKIA